MWSLPYLGLRLATCVVLIVTASGCAQEGSKSPELLNRCFQLHRLWWRYETANTINLSGQRAQAELALHHCQRGELDRGLKELERLLRRDLIPFPPA
jgi:hypothetical protein